MRVEGLILLIWAAFFGVAAIVYFVWSGETSGTAMLTGTFLLGLLPGSYYFWWSRRMKPRPSDDPHAELEDGAGVVGAFPSSKRLALRARHRCGLGWAVAGLRLLERHRRLRRGGRRSPRSHPGEPPGRGRLSLGAGSEVITSVGPALQAG